MIINRKVVNSSEEKTREGRAGCIFACGYVDVDVDVLDGAPSAKQVAGSITRLRSP